jgi:hypothetical protein
MVIKMTYQIKGGAKAAHDNLVNQTLYTSDPFMSDGAVINALFEKPVELYTKGGEKYV